MRTARTMKVYGRSRATRTIHMTRTPYTPIAK
jgi:flagellar basal body rod protein FlgF